jgi:hypothetical protein
MRNWINCFWRRIKARTNAHGTLKNAALLICSTKERVENSICLAPYVWRRAHIGAWSEIGRKQQETTSRHVDRNRRRRRCERNPSDVAPTLARGINSPGREAVSRRGGLPHALHIGAWSELATSTARLHVDRNRRRLAGNPMRRKSRPHGCVDRNRREHREAASS